MFVKAVKTAFTAVFFLPDFLHASYSCSFHLKEQSLAEHISAIYVPLQNSVSGTSIWRLRTKLPPQNPLCPSNKTHRSVRADDSLSFAESILVKYYVVKFLESHSFVQNDGFA
jgi:hypothetical protein